MLDVGSKSKNTFGVYLRKEGRKGGKKEYAWKKGKD